MNAPDLILSPSISAREKLCSEQYILTNTRMENDRLMALAIARHLHQVVLRSRAEVP